MVSIIIPVYNVEAFLPECIESIISQTYTDWELLLVDDGSTDSSGLVCDRYAALDSRIMAVHTPNRGVSAARNTGLEAARGEWVSFVDSDDHVAPAYIADMLSRCGDADVVVSGWSQDTLWRRFPDIVVGEEDFLQIFIHKAFINIWGKIIRRSVIEQAGARFHTQVKWAEDSIFFIKVLLSSHQVRLISQANYFYRQRDDSAVGKINSYESELAAFNAVYALMPEMLRVCSEESKKYFGPYLFLLRTYQAVHRMDISFREKLSLLKPIRFEKKYLFYKPLSYNEKFITWLFMNKRWRTLLRINK